MRHNDEYRMYRSFEEFEREELRRMDAMGVSVDEMIDTVFAEELDFDADSVRRSARDDEDEE